MDESSDYSASPEPLELPEPTEPAAKRCRRLIPFSLEELSRKQNLPAIQSPGIINRYLMVLGFQNPNVSEQFQNSFRTVSASQHHLVFSELSSPVLFPAGVGEGDC